MKTSVTINLDRALLDDIQFIARITDTPVDTLIANAVKDTFERHRPGHAARQQELKLEPEPTQEPRTLVQEGAVDRPKRPSKTEAYRKRWHLRGDTVHAYRSRRALGVLLTLQEPVSTRDIADLIDIEADYLHTSIKPLRDNDYIGISGYRAQPGGRVASALYELTNKGRREGPPAIKACEEADARLRKYDEERPRNQKKTGELPRGKDTK